MPIAPGGAVEKCFGQQW